MATICKLNLSREEEKIQGVYSIEIPYEINHDFFMKASILINQGKIDGIPEEDGFAFPDYGSGIILYDKDIDRLLEKINKFEFNIDEILNLVEIPSNISLHDSRVIVGYESHFMYDKKNDQWYDSKPYSTYAITYEDSYFICEKKDIIYILHLIRNLCNLAKDLNKGVVFEGE